MPAITATFPSIIASGKSVGYGVLVLTYDTEKPQKITCGFGVGEGQKERELSLNTLKTAFKQNGASITEGDTYVRVHRLFLHKAISFIVENAPAVILAGPVHRFVKDALALASTVQSA